MSELTFCKGFLSSLDSKPIKLAADHVFSSSAFPPRVPYTLPRLSHPPHPVMPKRSTAPPPPPGSTPTNLIAVTLKSSRNPALEVTLKDVNADEATVQGMKESVQRELGGQVPLEKIKILHNKKPTTKKTLAELLEGQSGIKNMELGIMIIGGAATVPSSKPAEEAASPARADDATPMEGVEKIKSPAPAQGPNSEEIPQTEEFWGDLKGFLEQRLKDESEAGRLQELFRKSWKSTAS